VQGWLYTGTRVATYWYKGSYILVQGWLYTGTRVVTYWYKGGYMGTAFSDTVLYTGNLYAQDLCCDNSSYRCDRNLVDACRFSCSRLQNEVNYRKSHRQLVLLDA